MNTVMIRSHISGVASYSVENDELTIYSNEQGPTRKKEYKYRPSRSYEEMRKRTKRHFTPIDQQVLGRNDKRNSGRKGNSGVLNYKTFDRHYITEIIIPALLHAIWNKIRVEYSPDNFHYGEQRKRIGTIKRGRFKHPR